MNEWLLSKSRLAGYTLAALAVISAVAWAEYTMWLSVTDLRERAEATSSDRFHLSDQLQARIHALHEAVLRTALEPAEEAPSNLAEAEALREWFAEHHTRTLPPPQRQTLRQAESAFSEYARRSLPRQNDSPPPQARLAGEKETERWVNEMLAAAEQLNRLEKVALSEFVEGTRTRTTLLYQRLILSSTVLLIMGSVLGLLAYSGVLAPLLARLKRTERIIERQEKLSSLGILAAGIAHEIRNPLTSIKARLYTQEPLLERHSEAHDDNLFITEEISRLEKIVADVLAFARPSDPRRVPVKATQPLRDVAKLFRPALDAAQIELKTEFLADPTVLVDPDQLKQVLINLLRNASESIGQNGSITLRSRLQKRRRVTDSKPMAVLEVEDTGGGIPVEARTHLFDPFFTTKASGTGLGLSLAARILEMHGGTLEYETELNRGTIFRLVLPLSSTEK